MRRFKLNCGHCGRTDIIKQYNYLHRIYLYTCIHCGWEEPPPEIVAKPVPMLIDKRRRRKRLNEHPIQISNKEQAREIL